jgi:ABC-type transport system involved in cytochrome c biogenesis permease subunit
MSATALQNVTHACFGLSYLLAWGFELARLRWPRPYLRTIGLVAGGAGLVAHTAYLTYHHPSPAAAYGALLLLGWVLAVFALYGSLHHARQAWGVFVLPIVLLLVVLSFLAADGTPAPVPAWLIGEHFWGAAHGLLVVLSAVGVSVGFIASVMYLVQARRLRRKANPLRFAMLSLERLEAMNRRAVNLAFPMLTAGLLLGGLLLRTGPSAADWLSVKVLGTAGLWLVFLVLLYARYAGNVPGRRLAWLTILAFTMMVAVLIATHPFAEVR